MVDVVVVGAGPGGAAAAKRCAEQGLETLLLEKKKLPRDKVCSGLLLGRMAKTLVEDEFGPVPKDVLLANLSGLILWMPGVGERKVPAEMPITWRRDLDYWMVQKAQAAGAEVQDDVLVRGVVPEEGKDGRSGALKLSVRKAGVEQEIKARFVIGADGAYSSVRRAVYPGLDAPCSPALRECYQGTLPLDEEYCYVIFPRGTYRPSCWVCPKGDHFTLEGGGIREVGAEIRSLLAAYGWQEQPPLWKDGCVSRVLLVDHLATGAFTPARGNVLLVGDAAGLKIHVSGEGIGTAIKSALIAAESIAAALKAGREVAPLYIGELAPLVQTLESGYREVEQIKGSSGQALLDGLGREFEESLEIG